MLIENNVGAKDAILKFNEFNTDNTEDNLPAVSVSIDENGNNIINYPYSIDRNFPVLLMKLSLQQKQK